jgi:hypothetical protein
VAEEIVEKVNHLGQILQGCLLDHGFVHFRHVALFCGPESPAQGANM